MTTAATTKQKTKPKKEHALKKAKRRAKEDKAALEIGHLHKISLATVGNLADSIREIADQAAAAYSKAGVEYAITTHVARGVALKNDLVGDLRPLALKLVALGCSNTTTAYVLKVSRMCITRWSEDPAFGEAFQQAQAQARELVADAMFAGALKVAQDPRYTTAAIFWLKNRDPNNWQDVQDVRHSGDVALSVQQMSDSELLRLAETAGLDVIEGETVDSNRVFDSANSDNPGETPLLESDPGALGATLDGNRVFDSASPTNRQDPASKPLSDPLGESVQTQDDPQAGANLTDQIEHHQPQEPALLSDQQPRPAPAHALAADLRGRDHQKKEGQRPGEQLDHQPQAEATEDERGKKEGTPAQ